MYKFLFALATMTATSASAQSAWDGPYAGGTVATFSGTNTYDNGSESSDFNLEGLMLGAFAGYDLPMENFVIGGEISFLLGNANEEDFEDEYEYTSFVNLKGRLGVVYGDVLPYVIAGASFATFAFEANDGGESGQEFEETEVGMLLGIGADYAVTDQLRVGAEVVVRSFEFEFPLEADLANMEGTVNSFALRGSYRF
ncbi:MAG: outer membrane beta-barrel protein [Pseudomonadota bacterium]